MWTRYLYRQVSTFKHKDSSQAECERVEQERQLWGV